MPTDCQERASAARRNRCFALAALILGGAAFAQPAPVTAELRHILEAEENDPLPAAVPKDSAARAKVLGAEWEKRFRPRHARVADMIGRDLLVSPEDFSLAGNVFLHGITADDQLLAYQLLTVAATLGHRDARWQSAEALDAFLVAVGRPQLFGVVLGGARHVVGDPAIDPLRQRHCLPTAAKLDQFARLVADRRSGTLDRQPVTNMLFWSESSIAGSRAFRARSGVVLTPLVITCPRALASADDSYLAGTVLRRSTAPNDKLLAHALLTIAAIEGSAAARCESALSLDDFLMAIGRPRSDVLRARLCGRG